MALCCIVSDIKRYIGRKSRFFSYFTCIRRRIGGGGGSPSVYCHEIWYVNTRMVSLLNCEKKFDDMFSHFDTVPACDRRTSYDSVVRAMHTYRAVISDEPVLSGVVNEGDVGGSSLCSQCVTRWRCSRAMKRVAPTGAVSANLAANHRCRTCSHVSR